jgi:cell division protease FtsH
MVTKYGMSDKIGPISFGSEHDEVFVGRDFAQTRNISESVAAEIDAEVRTIIDDCYTQCKELISSNLDKLENVVSRNIIGQEVLTCMICKADGSWRGTCCITTVCEMLPIP